MNDKEIEEKLEVLSKKILELEKRVDTKINENEKKLEEKINKIVKKETLLALGLYIKTIDDIKKILKVIRINIIILGAMVLFLYIFLIILIIKLSHLI